MSKLGYTWYPKDWGNSDAVFELTLIERGLYRELIDMAMLSDNEIIINYRVWSRKFGTTQKELESILITLVDLELINILENKLFIPSCEPRLKLSRGGKKGGKKSRKNKPSVKPSLSLLKNKDKPTPNQIESKVNIKENKEKELTPEHFLNWFNNFKIKRGFKSNVKRLTPQDRTSLSLLTKSYTGDDFNHALGVLLMDKWAKDNNQLIPSHFLKIDNFTKYLNTELSTPKTFGQKLAGL